MDFSFTEEQEILRSSVRRLLNDCYGFAGYKAALASAEGLGRSCWPRFAEMGLLALPFDETDGGVGASAIETMIVMEECGHALMLEPYLATIVLAGGLIRHGGSAEQRAELVPQICSGQRRFAFASAEHASRYNSSCVRVRAERAGSSFVVNGTKIAVLGAPSADGVFVSTRTAGSAFDEFGITVLLIDAHSKGVSMNAFRAVDGQQAAHVTFENVVVPREAVFGEVDHGLPLVERVIDDGIIAICADAVGAMERLNQLAIEYCKTRTAFGKPIGSFQALQHRLVDMYIGQMEASAITTIGALSLDMPAHERARTVSATKVKVEREGRRIAQGAVQLHGGIGTTEELSVGAYFKRLLVLELLFGNADYHARRFASFRSDGGVL